MKPISLFFVTLATLVHAVWAAPRLVVSTPSLAPESKIDLVFDLAVVDADTIGSTTANDRFSVQPALAGQLHWKAPNIAEFLPDQAPAMNTTYVFSMLPGSKHIDGSAIPAGEFARVSSETFRPLGWNSSQYRWSNDFSASTASWIVYFNDAVDASALGSRFHFVSDSGKSIPAVVAPVTIAAMGHYGPRERTWSARWKSAADTAAPNPDQTAPHAVKVTPASPLPPAKRWDIVLEKGSPNQSATARTTQDIRSTIGEIRPFRATDINAVTIANEPRHIAIEFNAPIPKKLPDNLLSELIQIHPRPDNLQVEAQERGLHITGALADQDEYSVTIRPSFASRDGLPLEQQRTESIRFQHLDPGLALPSNQEAQFAKGSRSYGIETVNVSRIQLRVKHLTGANLVRTFQGYENYTGQGHDGKNISPTAPLPWAMVNGTTVASREFDLTKDGIDTSRTTTFVWDDLLPGHTTGTFFLDAIGDPHEKIAESAQRRNSQAIIQLTDIGLAWKITPHDTFIQAFSCESGKPLSGVSLQLYGEDAVNLHTATTDAHGLATMPRDAKGRHLLARIGKDSFITAFDDTMSTVGLWHFPVRYSWLKPAEVSRRAFLFTDRPLYRPGETVRMKGIIRNLRGNTLEPAGTSPARIVLLDPAEKEILTRNITISANGSFDFTHTLAPETVGNHLIRLEFPDELAQLPQNEDEDYRNWQTHERIRNNAIFSTYIQVQEFRRNAFEITQKLDPGEPGAAKLTGTLAAKYYQGPPVASGPAKQYATVTTSNPYPERFRDFLFGNHRTYDWNYWYHYFGYRWDSEEARTEPFQHHAEFQLDAEGNATFEVPIPASEFPTRRHIRVATEVTDSRLQTLTATTTATVDPASVYVGISRSDRLVRAGDEVALKIVAVDTAGNPFNRPLVVNASITREVNESTKVVGENNSTTTRNNVREESVTTSQFTLDPASSQGEGHLFPFRPTTSGLHFITLHGTDPEGRPFSTVTRYHVYGTKDYPWLYEDGLRIKLVAEKTKYQPGETARILVLSPIEGTALVTIEREKVLRSFQVELRGDNPVVEIPLTDDDAPNAYVSVLVIKGAAESAREHKMPQLRLGYCELIVENQRDRLAVSIDQPESSYRPGEEITLTGKVLLADGKPAEAAEVTFFAEDEGTLAVTGYETPDPMAYFYRPRLLQVDSGISFDTFLSENPEYRGYYNKGFFIGGGGDMAMADELRKNFDPCATWAPTLVTSADGTFRHTFRLPDTLTRYRVIAVAHHATTRFGHAESAVTAKKDLMLEPKPPRFAHQGDELRTQLLVQNTSLHNGTWNITFSPHATTGQPVCSSTSPPATTVSLAAGASTTLEFPIRAEWIGEAVLAWQAVPVSLERGTLTPDLTKRLSDAVESRFPVQNPMPLMRQTRLIGLDQNPADILSSFDAQLRQGSGSITLEVAFSPLVEAAGSIDYLLRYPHGCLEQTSSALIPWCSVDALRDFVPAFADIPKAKIQDALQGGVNRLLSMQLADGSFSYWPGQTDAVDWATPYAAMVMFIAADRGAHVPESAKESLCQALIAGLRGMADTTSTSALETHARSLYALALAGKSQVAYQNSLAERSADLTPSARALLAAAIARSGPDQRDAARALLTSTKPPGRKSDDWMRHSPAHALNLLAWAEIDPTSSNCHKALDQILRDRNPYGHWNTTWVNGWSLVALATYAENQKLTSLPEESSVQITTDAGTETILLNKESNTASRVVPHAHDMKLTASANPAAYLRATIATRPAITPVQPVSANGMSIDRIHQRILPNGGIEPLDQPAPGDLILVTLRVTMPADNTHYLVVEDPLPSIFETVSSDFSSQQSAIGISTSENNWRVSHSELRDDRAVFYLDRVWHRGTYTLSYLARCTLPGTAYAPPAKVETMYDPENAALSASREFITR